jgi:hypothetical protein
MGNRATDLAVPQGSPEVDDLQLRDWFGAPLIGVLGKELDTLASERTSRQDSSMIATGNRKMGTKEWQARFSRDAEAVAAGLGQS